MFSKSTVKYIQSLQHKKFRDEYGVFVAEGPKLVEALLMNNVFACKNIYATKQWVDSLDGAMRAHAGMSTIIEDFELEKIAAFPTPNKVVAVFEKKKPAVVNVKHKLTLVLDDIQDPGNLGTIIRTADWFGIDNIVCSPNTVDMYNPKVVQSTMASLGNVNITYSVLPDWLKKQKPIKILAATLKGKSLNEYKKGKEAIIIIGNESKGISDELLQLANETISIPGFGKAESLNAAVATGIILAELTKN